MTVAAIHFRQPAAWSRHPLATSRREDGLIHWVIVVAIIVALAMAMAITLVSAGIAMCAAQHGVLDFVLRINPGEIKFGCKRI